MDWAWKGLTDAGEEEPVDREDGDSGPQKQSHSQKLDGPEDRKSQAGRQSEGSGCIPDQARPGSRQSHRVKE